MVSSEWVQELLLPVYIRPYITMRRLLFTFLLLLQLPVSYGEIYYCSDESGMVIFKDSACGTNEETIRVIEDQEVQEQEVIVKTPNNTVIKDGKPGKLIFRDDSPLISPYKIKVNEVRIITETEDNLVVDVIYTYNHEVPVEEIKLFVLPNHGYWSTADIKISKGENVGRASIGLSKNNMKKDRTTRSFTDTLKVSFQHYLPDKYNGVIWSETVKYEKNWVLKR